MKLLIGCIITAIFIVVVVTADRPTYTLEPQWSGFSNSFVLGNFGISAKKDLLVYPDYTIGPVITIRRRNTEGVYVKVADFIEFAGTLTSTNGKWVVVVQSGNQPTTVLFNIDSNNNISKGSSVPTRGGFLLSDDTFVGYDPVAPNNDGIFRIRTYQYEASNSTWINIPGTEVIVRTDAQYVGDVSTYRATDTHLVYLDTSDPSNFVVNIYKRQPDLSWKFVDSVPVNSGVDQYPGSVSFNGETLVYARPTASVGPQAIGEVYVYTKTNNGWTEQTFNLVELGYRSLGALGYTVVFIDADTMLFSVGYEGWTGSVSNLSGGKVLLLTRENGTWNDTLDLVGSPGLFGAGLAINDRDIIVASLTSWGTNAFGIAFFTAPVCFTNPINVTCMHQQLDSCSDLSFNSLYTVNNPQCGAVTSSTNGFSLVNTQELEVQFSFTKIYGPTAYCNATVTCPTPPIAPASVGVVVPVAPVGVVVPVSNVQATPTTTRVRSAGMAQLGLVSLVITVVLLLIVR